MQLGNELLHTVTLSEILIRETQTHSACVQADLVEQVSDQIVSARGSVTRSKMIAF